MSQPALLFDLDGTITDPSPGFLLSMYHALDTLGQERPSEDTLLQYIGPPLHDTMHRLLATDDQNLIEQAVQLYRSRLDEGGKFEASVIQGIPEVLDHFHQKGHPLFVCTGKQTGIATEIIDHFGLSHYFWKVYGSGLDSRHDDKAHLIRYIWEVEKIDTPSGVMVGDTIFDIRGARANQLKTVAVRWGFGKESDLIEEGADIIISTTAELIPAIEGLL